MRDNCIYYHFYFYGKIFFSNPAPNAKYKQNDEMMSHNSVKSSLPDKENQEIIANVSTKILRFATGLGPKNTDDIIREQLMMLPSLYDLGHINTNTLKVIKDRPLVCYVLAHTSSQATDKIGDIEVMGNDALCYMVEAEGTPFANITVLQRYGSYRGLINVGAASYAAVLSQAVRELMTMDELQSGSYEPRRLDFNPYSPVIWLKSISGGYDYIYTIGAVPTYNLPAHTLYTADKFSEIVYPILNTIESNTSSPTLNGKPGRPSGIKKKPGDPL